MLYWYKSTNTDAAAAASPQGKSPRLSRTALALSRSLSPKHLQHLQQTHAAPATSPTAPSLSPKHLQHLQHLEHADAIEVEVAGRPQPVLLGVVCPHRRVDVVRYSLYCCFTRQKFCVTSTKARHSRANMGISGIYTHFTWLRKYFSTNKPSTCCAQKRRRRQAS